MRIKAFAIAVVVAMALGASVAISGGVGAI